MNDEPSDPVDVLDALAARVREIEEQLAQVHACEEHLEIRARTFGGGSVHFVRQCTICGQQRSGPLKASVARTELAGKDVPVFDPGADDQYRAARSALYAELSELQIKMLEIVRPETAAANRDERTQIEAAHAEVELHMTKAVDASTPLAHREHVLVKALLSHRDRYTPKSDAPASKRFGTEKDLADWLEGWIRQDFEVWKEVPGMHLAEQARVRIDYVLRPKQHLVEAGFHDGFFGMELKLLPIEHGFSPKASRAVRQAMSYIDCEFDLEAEMVRLPRVLLFTNMSFEFERLQLRGLDPGVLSNDRAKWAALLELANHANVGTFDIYGTRESFAGWRISFAAGKYFGRHLKRYELANPRLFEKVRIGNF